MDEKNQPKCSRQKNISADDDYDDSPHINNMNYGMALSN